MGASDLIGQVLAGVPPDSADSSGFIAIAYKLAVAAARRREVTQEAAVGTASIGGSGA
jgi:hypothetical protein